MLKLRSPRRFSRFVALAFLLLAMIAGAAADQSTDGGRHSAPNGHRGRPPAAASAPVVARTVAAVRPDGGVCSVPGIGDIGGLLGFCNLGTSGVIGGLNTLCQSGAPQPESASTGLDAIVKPPASPAPAIATPYAQYGMAGQFWAATGLNCSDMTSLIGNDVAGMIFDFAKAIDRVTITVYQSAAGEGILGWLQNATDRLITGLGKAIYFPYLAAVVILAAIWLAWQGLIRKRGTRTIEGTVWVVLACAAAIWLIGRPGDFTALGKGVSDGISTTLNAAFAHLPSPGQAACLPVARGDPQINPASFSYTAGRTVVDQNANELWTVLVCKPWLDGEFGSTALATAAGHPTPVNRYARQLLWAQAIAANERPTTALVTAKQATYAGIANSIQQRTPSIYPLFQGKEWTTRLEIAFAALLAAVVAGVLVLIISVTLILLKLGFLLLLVVGPFFLLIGTHPGFGRVIAVRWFEMLVGVLLKQAAVALALSVLLYSYALIMGTTDAVLPWALKILMITLVTVAVFIYRKPFQHLFSAVGYGAIGSTQRAEDDLRRAAATASANTLTAATLAIPGVAAYRAARWARRNPAQAAGLALSAATAASTGSLAAGAATAGGAGAPAGSGAVPAGAGASGADHAVGASFDGAAGSRARAWGGSAGSASAAQAPPLKLPQRLATPVSWVNGGQGRAVARGKPTTPASGGAAAPAASRPAAWPGNGAAAGASAGNGAAAARSPAWPGAAQGPRPPVPRPPAPRSSAPRPSAPPRQAALPGAAPPRASAAAPRSAQPGTNAARSGAPPPPARPARQRSRGAAVPSGRAGPERLSARRTWSDRRPRPGERVQGRQAESGDPDRLLTSPGEDGTAGPFWLKPWRRR